ncbi:hypothetical protein D3C75_1166890 [compost metagenome]
MNQLPIQTRLENNVIGRTDGIRKFNLQLIAGANTVGIGVSADLGALGWISLCIDIHVVDFK